MSRVFANGPRKQGSLLGRVIPKTPKMVTDTSLLNTQHYKVRINGKVEQSKEWSSDLPYTTVLKLLKREPLGHPRLRSPTIYIYIYIYIHTHYLSISLSIYIFISLSFSLFHAHTHTYVSCLYQYIYIYILSRGMPLREEK